MGEHKYPGYTALLPPRVRYDAELPATAKLLYAEITAMTDVTGFCWASNRYLGELTGVGADRASRLIAQLTERGYLETEVLRDEKNNVTERRIYVTDLGLVRLPPPVKNTGTPPGKNTGSPPGENTGTPPGKNTGRVHIEKNEESIERIPPYNPPKGGRRSAGAKNEHRDAPEWKPEAFVKLWAWYPTGEKAMHSYRGGKQRAIRAWDKLHPDDAMIDTIAEALARQAASEQWKEGVGIPHLSTYLNGYMWEGWEEE